MPSDAPYSIGDLARLTGLSVRTIRYYLAQGLIPASGESGPGAHYGEGHLDRLRLVRRLQQQHLPLAEIRARLAALSDADVATLAAGELDPQPAPSTSALEYVRDVLAGSNRTIAPAQRTPPTTSPTAAAAPPAAHPPAPTRDAPAGMPLMRDTPPGPPRLLRRIVRPLAAELHEAAAQLREAAAGPALPLATAALPAALDPSSGPSDAAAPAPQSIERSQWERLSLGPNLELHVRRPLGRLEQKRVERLITIARQVLKEEQP